MRVSASVVFRARCATLQRRGVRRCAKGRGVSVAALRVSRSLRSFFPADGAPGDPAYFRFDARFFRPPVFLRPLDRLRPPLDFRFDGTFAPFLRASESPIAIACFLLFTLPPFPPRPRRNVPFFRFFIARSTRLPADLPYLRPLFFRVAMSDHPRSGGWVVHARRKTSLLRARAAPAFAIDVYCSRSCSLLPALLRFCLPGRCHRYIVRSSRRALAR